MKDERPIPTPELIARDLAAVWHPCSQMRDYEQFQPLHVVSARGTRIQLADGREILDAISSWWCKSLGHGHPKLREALIRQAEKFEHVILANTTQEPTVRLCEKLCAIANVPPAAMDSASVTPPAATAPSPGHFGKVFLAGDGSVGMEIALKMALQAQAQRGQPQRTMFAHFANGYHGETVGTLAVGDCGIYGEHFRPLLFASPRLTPLPYRGGPGTTHWMNAEEEWQTLEKLLEPLAASLAGIVYEPVLQGAGGMRLYSPDLLPRLVRWARAHDVYLIADEIAAGMGRLGTMLASHLAMDTFLESKTPLSPGRGSFDPAHRRDACATGAAAAEVLPDFLVLSKGLTSGYLPLSAVLTTNAIYQLFDADYVEMKAFLHSNTYTGHALAAAVALAALQVMEEEKILDQVAQHGPLLRAGLHNLAGSRAYLRNVRGCGMMAAADITQHDGTALDWRKRTGFAVYQAAVRRGALLRNLGDTMYLFPPLNTPAEDVEAMLRILGESLDEVMG